MAKGISYEVCNFEGFHDFASIEVPGLEPQLQRVKVMKFTTLGSHNISKSV
jgi:hypothetical protein